MNASIYSHLPDPSLGFGDSNTGSDSLKIIEKFLDNNQAPICGSKIVILVKRYPNQTDIDRLVAKLRKYHTRLTVVCSMTPSGGHHSETLYKLATKTNGFCVFDHDSDFHTILPYHVPSSCMPFFMYAANPQISGQGNISLATMRVPAYAAYWFELTIKDQMPIDASETVELTWTKFGTNWTPSIGVSGGKTLIDPNEYYTGNHVSRSSYLSQSSYSMYLKYKFSDSNLKTLQIRVYSPESFGINWPPYDN